MFATLHVEDTIAALASAPGPAERGIIRVSGPETKQLIGRVFVPGDRSKWEGARGPRRHRGSAVVPGLHLPLAVDVLLWPSGRSYTGQPAAELHTIGSPPVLEALLGQLFSEGARPAQRGEFSLRAFLSGRIDLVQAEAVLGVIEATDQEQLRLALDQLGGGLSRRICALHEELLMDVADLEAGLDFVEEDVEFVTRDLLMQRIEAARAFLLELRSQATSRLQTTGRLKVVLAGLPNAGKSSLLNALSGKETALVSRVPGTTRDYLTVAVEWRGLGIDLIDTAGWERDVEADRSQRIGRAAGLVGQDQWRRADLILWCSAADMDPSAAADDAGVRDRLVPRAIPVLQVATKADLVCTAASCGGFRVSSVTEEGLDELKDAVVESLSIGRAREAVLGSTAARCQESLRGAAEALERAGSAAAEGRGDELISLELRSAIEHLGQVTGQTGSEDILDRIFSRFCIGK